MWTSSEGPRAGGGLGAGLSPRPHAPQHPGRPLQPPFALQLHLQVLCQTSRYPQLSAVVCDRRRAFSHPTPTGQWTNGRVKPRPPKTVGAAFSSNYLGLEYSPMQPPNVVFPHCGHGVRMASSTLSLAGRRFSVSWIL